MRLVVWLLTNAVAVAVAAWLFDGIAVAGDRWQDEIGPLLGAALILGLVTVFVRPVVKLLSLPVIVLTIGLFLLVVNALMLLLTGWIAEQVGVGFTVDGFWTALLGALVVTIVTGLLDLVIVEEEDRR